MALTKVLVVDDSLTSRKYVIQSIRSISTELTIVEADDGRRALDLLNENPDIDMVISDDIMPYLDGFDLVTHMRAQEAWNKVPVMILGSEVHAQATSRALQAGASSYMPRPASRDQIVETVLNLANAH